MHHVGSLRFEGRSTAGAPALVPCWNAVASNVGLDTFEHCDGAVRSPDDGDRDPASDAGAVARQAEVDHRFARFLSRSISANAIFAACATDCISASVIGESGIAGSLASAETQPSRRNSVDRYHHESKTRHGAGLAYEDARDSDDRGLDVV